MHEHVFAGLRGDEAVALVGVEPFHGSNRHVLVPPSIVSEVSTNADANSNADGKGQARPACCQAKREPLPGYGSGCGHCPRAEPGLRDAAQRVLAALEPRSCAAAASGVLPGPHLESGVMVVVTLM